jgi:hypothetical protein
MVSILTFSTYEYMILGGVIGWPLHVRGKSGLHRAECFLTGSPVPRARGESATENEPPRTTGAG